MFLRSAAERRTRATARDKEDVFLAPGAARTWKSRLRIAALVLGAWAVLGFLQANVIYFLRVSAGIPTLPLIKHLPWTMLGMGLWALLTPLVLHFARRFPISGPHPVRNGLIHVALGLGVHVVMML